MDQRSLDDRIKNGFRLAGKTLIAICTVVALVAGIGLSRSHEGYVPGSLLARHPSLPWICLVVAAVIVVSTIDHWAAILPGFLGYATIGGLIMLITGKYNHVNVPWPVALALTVFCIVSSLVTRKFVDRPLTLIDRAALVALVFCLAFSVTSKNNIVEVFTVLSSGFVCILVAWGIDYAKRPDRAG